ncbi:hypothetical protein [Mycolicibacterium tusciae]|uniref:hypothetical protein n=1 Tax=Mycolicibacterium tusciae TaxID=75922 RepID=UPI003C6E6C17
MTAGGAAVRCGPSLQPITTVTAARQRTPAPESLRRLTGFLFGRAAPTANSRHAYSGSARWFLWSAFWVVVVVVWWAEEQFGAVVVVDAGLAALRF